MPNLFSEIKTKAKIPTYKYFVEGEWQESRNRKLNDIKSPIDCSLLGRIQTVSKKEADIAVTGASIAFEQWINYPLAKKIIILKKFAKLILQNKKTLTKLLTVEVGKTISDAEKEIESCGEIIEKIIKQSKEEKETQKSLREICKISYLPRGVVLCITPFNYPINTVLFQIVPALISGNTVILKPATSGAISTLHLIQLLKKAGLPEGVLNVVTGHGEDIGRFLAEHDLIRAIYFTGSTKTGKDIAKRAGIVRLVMELGGKDAAIVLKDANIDKTAKEIAESAFAYSGQRCMAIKRVVVDEKIKTQLLEKIHNICEENFSRIGDPRDAKTQMGPVISDKQADYLESLIKDAKKKGAKIVCGGRRFNVTRRKLRLHRRLFELSRRLIRLRRGHGRYFSPTILDNIKPSMKIAWEEQFGPILPVISVKSENEAVNLTNASEYGLDAAIFTKDIKKARQLAEKLDVGQVFINMKPHRAPYEFPFNGTKNSGIGTQGIPYTQKAMTRPKSVRIKLR